MTTPLADDQGLIAARLALGGLAPLCGLAVDADRIVQLESLTVALLQQGEQLARTIEPGVEPLFMGVGRP